MVRWGELIQGAGEVLQGLSDVAIVANWLQMDELNAFNSIEAQIKASDARAVDRLDVALLELCQNQVMPADRRRATKLYAFFKMAELAKFGEYRGFPA